jgi:hypothetical protein
MDFDNPSALISSIFIGLIGMGLFMYGKKQADVKCLAVGVIMCIFPYFITDVLAMWLVAAACIGGLWAAVKYLG